MKCGYPGCHCSKKPIHPVTRLSWWKDGKLKNKIVRVADRQYVEKRSKHYREHKKALSEINKLDKKMKEIINRVIKLKTVKYD